jgi:two-component system, LuxR family, response regulator FixJ
MKTLPPTVFIVDDDSGVRSSIRVLLKSIGINALPFPSAPEFLQAYKIEQPGCLILDIRMPGMSGLELQLELNKRGAVIPVIFITGHGDIPMAVEAMRHGAFDFVQKPFRDQELIDRVQQALARDVETRKDLQTHTRTKEQLASLTPRERQVLDLMVAGQANKVMAHDMGLSQRTVEIHRAHVMEKMQARSLAHLVRMIIDAQ